MTTIPLTTADLETDSQIVPKYWFQQDNLILDSEGDYAVLYEACDEGHAKFLMRLAELWQWHQDNPFVMEATREITEGLEVAEEVQEYSQYMWMRRNKGDWMSLQSEADLAERDHHIKHTPRLMHRILFGYKLARNLYLETEKRNKTSLSAVKSLTQQIAKEWIGNGKDKTSPLYQYWKQLVRIQDLLENGDSNVE